jgi:hypothetical protein
MPVPFIVPAVGWGLTALGGATGAYSLSQMPKNMRKDIVREGPDEFGEYNLNPIQKLMLDEDSLSDSRNKYVMDTAKKNPEIRQLQRLDPSLQLTNGMTAEDFKDTYAPQIRKIRTQEKIDEAGVINNAAYNSPQQVEERRVRNEQRTDLLNEQRLTREDTNNRFLYQERTADKRRAHESGERRLDRRHQSELADRSNDLQMQMSLMQSDLAEKRMDYDRETRRMDKRSQAIAQLMSGLGQLGGAFAL